MTKAAAPVKMQAARLDSADFNLTYPELDLECAPIVPVWPRPGTAQEMLLEILLRDGRTTIDDFLQATGSHEERKYISDLRDLAWPIETYNLPAPTPALPRRVIGLYVINLKKIDLAKVARP